MALIGHAKAGRVPLEMQSKLLRVLEEHRFTPVGGSQEVEVDVRIVAATNKALRAEVKRGNFREDLMYRLRVVPIFLSPLRERRGDVELLLRRFLDEFNQRGPRKVMHVSPDAMRALLDHDWPGNVRELRNVVEYAFAVGRGQELLTDELPPEFGGVADPDDGPAGQHDASERANEREQIERALSAAGGRVSEPDGALTDADFRSAIPFARAHPLLAISRRRVRTGANPSAWGESPATSVRHRRSARASRARPRRPALRRA